VLAAVLVLSASACTRGADDAAFDFDFEIPAGTYERVTRGEDVDIFPAELRATVGQRIRIVNRDLVGQTIGPYYVGPQSTVQQTFRSAGTIEGLCTAHPSRSIRIVVSDPDGAGASTSGTGGAS
jgi:plastocyanin